MALRSRIMLDEDELRFSCCCCDLRGDELHLLPSSLPAVERKVNALCCRYLNDSNIVLSVLELFGVDYRHGTSVVGGEACQKRMELFACPSSARRFPELYNMLQLLFIFSLILIVVMYKLYCNELKNMYR